MSEVAAELRTKETSAGGGADWIPLLPRIAWRNLARRRYRTWMSAASFAFAILLVGCGISLQAGSYVAMIKRGTELLSGHGQFQHPGWLDDPKMEYLLENPDELKDLALQVPGVSSVAVRVQASGLVGNSDAPDEAGKAGMVMGVDPESEPGVSVLADRIIEGRYLGSGDEAILGEALARNLGLSVGGEIVVIGSALGGGTAALVCEVVGIFDAGFPALNRTLVQIPSELAAIAFNLEGKAHLLAMRFDDPSASEEIVEEIRSRLKMAGDPENVSIRDWKQVETELYSGIRMDALSSVFIYGIIILMVGFTILGSVLMVMFERRAEFGVLMALGMRTSSLRALMHWEVLWLWLIGTLIGLIIVSAFLGWFGSQGIPLPTDAETAELLESVHMDPKMYPAYSNIAFLYIPLLLLAMAQLAVVFGTRRLGKRLPAEVLRSV